MARINMKDKADKIIKAYQDWNAIYTQFSLDIRRECEDEWGPNYAIIEHNIEDCGDGYTDWDGVYTDLYEAVKDILGPRFKIVSYPATNKIKFKDGQLYCLFHGSVGRGEIELFRYKKAA